MFAKTLLGFSLSKKERERERERERKPGGKEKKEGGRHLISIEKPYSFLLNPMIAYHSIFGNLTRSEEIPPQAEVDKNLGIRELFFNGSP